MRPPERGLRHAASLRSMRIDVLLNLVNTVAAVALTCQPLSQEPLEAADAERLASALKAIADPARLRLLGLIQAQPGHEACVCHLTEPLGLSQPTVSHHLKVLLLAGPVQREQRGSWAYFRVREEPLAALRVAGLSEEDQRNHCRTEQAARADERGRVLSAARRGGRRPRTRGTHR
jgi:ArsR family transcriptional regulator